MVAADVRRLTFGPKNAVFGGNLSLLTGVLPKSGRARTSLRDAFEHLDIPPKSSRLKRWPSSRNTLLALGQHAPKGQQAISRWWSEARATPPDRAFQMNPILEGSQRVPNLLFRSRNRPPSRALVFSHELSSPIKLRFPADRNVRPPRFVGSGSAVRMACQGESLSRLRKLRLARHRHRGNGQFHIPGQIVRHEFLL